MDSIFESLENLDVSEECFESIIELTEEYLNETVWDQIKKVHGNSNKAQELKTKADNVKKEDSANQVQRRLDKVNQKAFYQNAKRGESMKETRERNTKWLKKRIQDKIKAHHSNKDKIGQRKTDERRAVNSVDREFGNMGIEDFYDYFDGNRHAMDQAYNSQVKYAKNNPREQFKEKWGDKIKTHDNYNTENKIKNQALKKLKNYMNTKEGLSDNTFNSVVEDIAKLRELAGIEGRGWDKEKDPDKERLRKKIMGLEEIRHQEHKERRKKWPEGLADSIKQNAGLTYTHSAAARDQGRDTKNYVGMMKTKKRHNDRDLYNTNTGNSGIKVGPDSWVGADEPTEKDMERYNPVIKSIARNMKKSHKLSKTSEALMEEIMSIVENMGNNLPPNI